MNNAKPVSTRKLLEFAVTAKRNSFANSKKRYKKIGIVKRYEYVLGDFKYIDSYTGSLVDSGRELISYKGIPMWKMSYNGGMLHGFENIADDTFAFLKTCLSHVSISNPFRGPDHFEDLNFAYENILRGDFWNFKGVERIFLNKTLIYTKDYTGGLIK